MVKNLPVNAGCRTQKTRRFNPCIGKIPRGANGSPLQYSCWRIPWTGASAGYSLCGCTELDTAEATEHPWKNQIQGLTIAG